ncbi:MAG: hypothetical protein K2L03_06290, partial [Bacteroidales bacterium]|nr:hypothetical protein [Bacteroidales bacterium]
MKKAVLVCLLALIGGWASAQRHTYLFEGFVNTGSSLSFHPELWDSDRSGLEAMYFVNSHEAGGEAPEVVWGYYPDYNLSDKLNGTYRLIFKKQTLLADHDNFVSVRYFYEATKNSAVDVRVLGLAVRKGSGEWQVCRQINIMTQNLGQGQLIGELPASLHNETGVQVCVFYTTPNDNIHYLLYIDDIEFFAYPTDDYRVNLSWRGDPFTATGRLNVGLVVENAGNKMETCEISYTLDGGEVKTMPLTFASGLLPDEVYVRNNFQPEGWDASAYGKHTVEFWLSKVNGTAIAEDKIQKQVKYLTNIDPAESPSYQFRPLVEHFSASTCPPCASVNSAMNPVYADLGDTISLIKYQMDFPGNGDPYYTEEGVARREYYGVNSVPTLIMDGSPLKLTDVNDVRAQMLNATKKRVYYGMWFDTVAMDENQHIHVCLKVKAVGGVENVVLHTVVEEGTTYGNVGTNGETEFHNVMMKMLPDANGAKMALLKPDTVYTFTYVYDMTQTNMEEFTDLSVVCFLQTESGEVLQSVIAKAGSYSAEPGALVRVDYLPPYICAEDVPVGLQVISTGGEALSSVEVEAKVGAAGTPVVHTYPVSMAWGENTYVTFDGLKATTPGADTVFFTVTKVNGAAFNGQAARCPIYVQTTQNAFLPLVEGFTSASNRGSATLNPYLDALEGACVVKYPMSGDKYMRTAYTRYATKLGIKGAPGLALDGHMVGVATNGELTYEDYFEALLAQARKNNSIIKVDLSDKAVISGNGNAPSVMANFNFEAPVSVTGYLYLLVVENVTEKNTGSNGEKQFKRVVQAMLPDESGTRLNIRDGRGVFVLNRSILNSKIENYNNLKLVVIIKDVTGKEVLQTAEFPIENQVPNEGVMAYESLEVYPNPASEYVYLKGLENATVEVFDLMGVKVSG